MAVQSKLTINHLLGLKAIESAFSMPFSHVLNSGQTKALPAYAASMCNQRFSSVHTAPTSNKSSNAQAPVVPKVAQTYKKT